MRSLIIAWIVLGAVVSAQRGAANGEWRAWGGDLGVTRYAPLDQIDASNFNTLQIAWRFKTENLGKRPDFNLQTVPLMINGVLYATAGEHRNAVAINAGTGTAAADCKHLAEHTDRSRRAQRDGAVEGNDRPDRLVRREVAHVDQRVALDGTATLSEPRASDHLGV